MRKEKNGFFYVYYTDKETGKRSKMTTATKLKPEALKFLSNFKENLKQRNHDSELRKHKIFNLSDLKTAILNEVQENTSPSNLRVYNVLFKGIIEFYGDVPIKKITFEEIERYKSARLQSVSKATVNKDLSTLKSIFNFALNRGWVKSNPVSKVKKIIIEEKKHLSFEPGQVKKILDNINNVNLKNIVLFALYTGCRLNEIINLQWCDINFNDKTISIQNKKNFKTKTGKNRIIPISDNLQTLINTLFTRNNDNKVLSMINPNDYIFQNPNRYKLTKNYISNLFKTVLRRLDFEEKYHFHCLRHTYITSMIKAGVSINYVKELAGHSNIQTTMLYVHLVTNDLRDAVNKVNII